MVYDKACQMKSRLQIKSCPQAFGVVHLWPRNLTRSFRLEQFDLSQVVSTWVGSTAPQFKKLGVPWVGWSNFGDLWGQENGLALNLTD